MENKGQVECDDFTYTGMLVGLGTVATESVKRTGWVGLLGAVGLGSTAGMVSYSKQISVSLLLRFQGSDVLTQRAY